MRSRRNATNRKAAVIAGDGCEAGSLDDDIDAGNRLSLAFRLTSGREPLADERRACEKFLATQLEVYAKDKDAADRPWADLCQMLLASNAFLYVE